MYERLNYFEVASRFAERRKHSRVQIKSLAYIELEQGNGGLILNVSEGGIAVRTAEMLIGTVYSTIRFRLPRSPQWIEVSGKLVWEGESRKTAGIQFADVGDDVRQRIQGWVKTAVSYPDTPANTGRSTIVWENEKLSFPPMDSDKVIVPAEFEAMFPSEKSLNLKVRAASISNFFPSEADQPVACPNRETLTSSTGVPSSDSSVAIFETKLAKSPPNQSDLLDVGVDAVGPNDVERQSLNCEVLRSLECNASARASSLKHPPSVQFVDPIAGRAFYGELMATHAAMNSHDLDSRSLGPQARLRDGAPTIHNPASRLITFTGLGYQAAEFEDPSEKGWLLVAAILVLLLAGGAVLAIGPGNVANLLARHNPAAVAGPPPPPGASETTSRSPNLPTPTGQGRHTEQESLAPARRDVQTSETTPEAIITETGR